MRYILTAAVSILTVAACTAADTPFKKQHLTEEFWAEGVAIGDLNKDGVIDASEMKARRQMMMTAGPKAAEGKCGEGKCGEGMCGASADKKPAEGKCGEGKCGSM